MINIVKIVTSMHLTSILHEHYYLVGSPKSPKHPHTIKVDSPRLAPRNLLPAHL